MAQKKLLTIAGLLATAGTAGVLGLSNVSAETSKGETNLVDRLTQRFNLNKEEVQKVFDEAHAEREAEHQTKMEERLDAAIKEGKLTEEQKTKILAKLEELKKNRPSKDELQGKTMKERRTFKEEKHQDLQEWAEENDIPEEYLPLRLHIRGPGGPGGDVHIEKFTN